MSGGLSAGARRTHSGESKDLRKGRGLAGAGPDAGAKWYATASLSLSNAAWALCGWQFGAKASEQTRGGGVMGAGAQQESHMDYQPAIF